MPPVMLQEECGVRNPRNRKNGWQPEGRRGDSDRGGGNADTKRDEGGEGRGGHILLCAAEAAGEARHAEVSQLLEVSRHHRGDCTKLRRVGEAHQPWAMMAVARPGASSRWGMRVAAGMRRGAVRLRVPILKKQR